MMESAGDQHESRLDKPRHVKYWMRCLKTYLPSLYTSNDSNRMYLAYFILSACDILGILSTQTTEAERADYVNWIYRCQHSNGGFRMWPGTDFGDRATSENGKWDPANVPGTYFALASLLILGDDLERVHRKETLKWIVTMQRPDGSFGETLVSGKIEGGQDSRLGYCATGVRYILHGSREGPLHVDGELIDDINVDTHVGCIHQAESFDGGMADAPFHEPQAGYTFCTLGCLAFIDRLREDGNAKSSEPRGPQYPENLLRWLVNMQTDFTDPDGIQDNEFSSKPPKLPELSQPSPHTLKPPNPAASQELHQSPDKSTMWGPDMASCPDPASISSTTTDLLAAPTTPQAAGMAGRTNKVADTCYAFWVSASLHILKQSSLSCPASLRRYLLDLTQQEFMGGFTKFPGDKYPDLYHSYLGLAALSLCSTVVERDSDGIKEVDAGMCVSKETKGRLKEIWGRWGVEG